MMKSSINITSILFGSILLFLVVRSQHLSPDTSTEFTTKNKKISTLKPSTTLRPKQCGTPSVAPYLSMSRIVGGVAARPHSWPWQISLQISGRFNCGGSILNETLVITAAHCIGSKASPGEVTITAGEDDFRIKSDGPTQTKKIKKIIIHEKYNPSSYLKNDIALLILETPLVFNQNISAVCLPKEPVISEQNSYATGWGRTNNAAISNQKLNQLRSPIYSQSDCHKLGGLFSIVQENQLCSGYIGAGKNVFKGDSGGPLVSMKADKRWYLQGIVSWGIGLEGSENFPAVYTRVFNYLSWITSKTGFTA